jgi:hypothetical protein
MRVCELLHQLHYSVQGNAKVRKGAQHPDRDAQFRYINARVTAWRRRHEPVISVDAKRKELIGDYHNPGRTWRPVGEPVEDDIPYGVYYVGRNRRWVEVGVDHDTATFAVAAIRAWWYGDGVSAYPKARRLLVTADAGGSNSYRAKLWKKELGALVQSRSTSSEPPPAAKGSLCTPSLTRTVTPRRQGHRPGADRPACQTPHVPRRMELHRTTRKTHNTSRVNIILDGP